MRCFVANIVDLGAAVREFHIRRDDGGMLPEWQPGAHIALTFAATDGTVFQKHYSLVGIAGLSATYRIAVQRERDGKGGSRCLHDTFAIGSVLEVAGPFNSFPLHITPQSTRITLIAGGIGITPMISMAHALDARGIPFVLHYLARSADRLVLMDALRVIPHATVVVHLSQESGRADPEALLGPYESGQQAYACGPVALLQALADAGERLGWPLGALHVESFGARTGRDDAPLAVSLALSQMTVHVQPGTSILDALIAADVFVSYDCKRGECSSCYTTVLEGQPRHRDVCLTAEMRSTGMCTCVSWAAGGRLVLDL